MSIFTDEKEEVDITPDIYSESCAIQTIIGKKRMIGDSEYIHHVGIQCQVASINFLTSNPATFLSDQ